MTTSIVEQLRAAADHIERSDLLDCLISVAAGHEVRVQVDGRPVSLLRWVDSLVHAEPITVAWHDSYHLHAKGNMCGGMHATGVYVALGEHGQLVSAAVENGTVVDRELTVDAFRALVEQATAGAA